MNNVLLATVVMSLLMPCLQCMHYAEQITVEKTAWVPKGFNELFEVGEPILRVNTSRGLSFEQDPGGNSTTRSIVIDRITKKPVASRLVAIYTHGGFLYTSSIYSALDEKSLNEIIVFLNKKYEAQR